MKMKKLYPIKFVAAQSGVKAHNIRSWEERYGAVKPERSHTNRRLYSEGDIQRLALLKQAVDSGHNISAVARLSTDELMNVVRRDQTRTPGAGDGPNDDQSLPAAVPEGNYHAIVEKALSHVVHLDSLALEKVLNEAAVDMPRQAFLQEVIMPLFREIGLLWRSGRMKIINEHMASVIVRSILWDMLRTVELSAAAPRIVIATPSGHWHEFGALACALVATESGWQPFYFGPNLPSEEIVYAVQKIDAGALTLSLCHRLNQHKLLIELRKIRRMVKGQVPIFIGGSGADKIMQTDENIKAVVIDDLDLFRRQLDSLES
ncbi:MAG: MerR family transcriptional regulator [Desulfobacterales bacterium]|nr:MerR family transcriptional regulator [Desulfobacterales bacterium]MDJ0884051.1 MerR family transcriptional regulator [Desulfobacterales bacterium]